MTIILARVGNMHVNGNARSYHANYANEVEK